MKYLQAHLDCNIDDPFSSIDQPIGLHMSLNGKLLLTSR